MLRFSEKAVGGCKSQIFFTSRGDTISEALRGNEMVLMRLLSPKLKTGYRYENQF